MAPHEGYSDEELLECLGSDTPSEGSNQPQDYDGLFTLTTKAIVDFENRVRTQKQLKDAKVGDFIEHILATKTFNLRKSRDKDSYYFDITANDATKELQVKRYQANNNTPVPENIKAIYVKGQVTEWKGVLDIKASEIALITDATELDASLLWPASSFTVKELKLGIWNRVQKIKCQHLKTLCEKFLKDLKYSEAFGIVPAGSSMHHSFKHGLLEHTYTAASIGVDVTELYNRLEAPNMSIKINPDIVFAGLLFHDAFKCEEYAYDGQYLKAGNLLKHLERGISYVSATASNIPNFPEDTRRTLCHLISAHHGKKDYGSWDTMNCISASIVHHIDDMASKLDPAIRELHFLKENEKYTTEKVKSLGGGSQGSEAYRGGITFDNPNYTAPRELSIDSDLTELQLIRAVGASLEQIEDVHLKKAVLYIYNKIKNDVKSAKYSHYRHGLLEFTYRLMTLSEGMVYIWHRWVWPGNRVFLNRDLIKAGDRKSVV